MVHKDDVLECGKSMVMDRMKRCYLNPSSLHAVGDKSRGVR